MSTYPRRLLALLFCSLAALLVPYPACADDWLPVTQDELKMTSEPKAPGAPALYLYRQVDRDRRSSAGALARLCGVPRQALRTVNREALPIPSSGAQIKVLRVKVR